MYTQTILIHSVQLSHPTAFLTSVANLLSKPRVSFTNPSWSMLPCAGYPCVLHPIWTGPQPPSECQGPKVYKCSVSRLALSFGSIQGFTPQKNHIDTKNDEMHLWLQLWLAILGIGCIFSFQVPSTIKSPHYPPPKEKQVVFCAK